MSVDILGRFRRMKLWKRIGISALALVSGLILCAFADYEWKKHTVGHEKAKVLAEYWDDEKRVPCPKVRMLYDDAVERAINRELRDKSKRLAESLGEARQTHPDASTENDGARVLVGRNQGGILSFWWEKTIQGKKHFEGTTFDLRTGKELSLEAFANLQKEPGEYSMEAIFAALAAKRMRGEIPKEWLKIRPYASEISYFIKSDGTLLCWKRLGSSDQGLLAASLAAWRDGAGRKLTVLASGKEYVTVFCGKTGGLAADISTARLEMEDENWRAVTAELSAIRKSGEDAGQWEKYAPLRWRFWQEKATGHIFFSRLAENPDGEPQTKSAPHLEKNPVIQRIFDEAMTEEHRGAAVETAHWENDGAFSYPVVRLEDKDAEAAINGEIEAAVRSFYERGQYFRRYRHKNDRFSLDYAVGLNDGKRLSLALHQRFHHAGSWQEQMEPLGMTFDLATGRRLDVEDYDEMAKQSARPQAYQLDAICKRTELVKEVHGYVRTRDNDRFFVSTDGHVAYLFEISGKTRGHQTEEGGWVEEVEKTARTFYLDLDAPKEMVW